MPLIRTLLLALLLAPSVWAAEPAWLAEPVTRATWKSVAIWPPSAVARATRTPEGITVQVTCAFESKQRTMRLRYFDADYIAERAWQSARVARIDGSEPIEIEHVDRADWQSQPLSTAIVARLRAGSFLVIERRSDPLRLQLAGMREALDQLDGMCVPK